MVRYRRGGGDVVPGVVFRGYAFQVRYNTLLMGVNVAPVFRGYAFQVRYNISPMILPFVLVFRGYAFQVRYNPWTIRADELPLSRNRARKNEGVSPLSEALRPFFEKASE